MICVQINNTQSLDSMAAPSGTVVDKTSSFPQTIPRLKLRQSASGWSKRMVATTKMSSLWCACLATACWVVFTS